jgi:hypothetical protein
MKAGDKTEELIKATYRLPKNVCTRLEELAIKHRRSINDELIICLKEYFAWQDEWVENKKRMEVMTPERIEGIEKLMKKLEMIEAYAKAHPEEFPL